MHKLITAITLGTVLVATGGSSRAETAAARFGDRGHVVIAASARGVFQYTSTDPPGDGPSSSVTEVELSPGLLYFVADNFAVGGNLTFQSTDRGGPSTTALGLGAVAGVNVPLGASVVSWMPQLGLSYLHINLSQGAADVDGFAIVGSLAAPFLFHVAPHFFIGAGPSVSYTLVSEVEGMTAAKVVQFGVVAQIGGWL